MHEESKPAGARGEPVVSLQQVGLTYSARTRRLRREVRGHAALKSVDLDLYRGETIGVIGRNGAGKSTLLRIVAGIIEPDFGKVVRRDVSVRLLGLNLGFLPDLSGWDNLVLGGLMLFLKKREIESRIPQIVEFAELEDSIHNPLRTYSSGMRARLAFSLAVSVPTDVLLIDELMGVGDCAFQKKSGGKLRELIGSDLSCIIVSHSAATITELCSRVVWVEDGETVMAGPTGEVLERYNESMLGR